MERKITKEIHIGDRVIGGGNPILIQSMTNTKTEDVDATVAQIRQLTQAGCDIIRCAVPTMEAACALEEIKKQVEIPVVADIHFDYRLAIAAMEQSRQHRVTGSYQGSRGCGKRAQHPDSCWGKQWFPGKRTGRKIPRRYGGRHCGERTG